MLHTRGARDCADCLRAGDRPIGLRNIVSDYADRYASADVPEQRYGRYNGSRRGAFRTAPLICARLLACGNIRYDASDPDAGYTLERILVHVRPADGAGFGFDLDRMFLFAQLWGKPDEYTLWVRMSRFIPSEDGGEIEVGEAVEFPKRTITLPGENYVECFGFPLVGVPFPEPGVYEFQLWAEGLEDFLFTERVEARE